VEGKLGCQRASQISPAGAARGRFSGTLELETLARTVGERAEDAVVVCDAHLNVGFWNNEAARLLASLGGALFDARLSCSTAVEDVLKAAIRRALQADAACIALIGPFERGQRLFCRVVPLRASSRGARGTQVLIALTPLHEPHRPNERFIARYGLTRAEAHVAALLAMGLRVREISAARRTSMNTVRTQVKHLLEKTHTRRQAELVALLKAQLQAP
jgi:DNA-binding CsgD family transcriptional regulator